MISASPILTPGRLMSGGFALWSVHQDTPGYGLVFGPPRVLIAARKRAVDLCRSVMERSP